MSNFKHGFPLSTVISIAVISLGLLLIYGCSSPPPAPSTEPMEEVQPEATKERAQEAVAETGQQAEAEPVEEAEPEPVEQAEVYFVHSLAIDACNLEASLIAFESKYFVYGEETKVHTIEHSEGAGSRSDVIVSSIPIDSLLEAKEHVVNAASLLQKGKLPTEIKPRPLDKNEVATELEMAKGLLISLLRDTHVQQERDTQSAIELGEVRLITPHIGQPYYEEPRINLEKTMSSIIETYDEYREVLTRMIGQLDFILEKLPIARLG